MKDYYAILGLDQEASPESIKLAYRRLAREHHPDRVGHAGAEAMLQAQNRMADLNEAYAVLSDSRQRREYDSKWRAEFAPRTEDLQTAVEAIKEEQEKAAEVQAARARARPKTEALTNMARQFGQQVRKNLMTNQKVFRWEEARFEGFEWGLESSFLLAKYFVGMRAFPIGDQAAAQKFTNYASFAVDMHQHRFKANYFLFLMAFQRMTNPDQLVAECKRWVQFPGARPTVQGSTSLIILMDAGHSRSVLCGTTPRDKRFNQLLQMIRLRSE